MILSIVIPIYRVENYISQCLQSILSQLGDNADVEVICVDDGSPDGSVEIVKKFQDKYSQLTLIRQQNQGLSVARNEGLKKAKGKYIWFFDSDDYLAENSLQSLLNVLTENYDGICLGYTKVYPDGGGVACPYAAKEKSVYSGKELFSYRIWNVGAVFTIYKKDFLEKYQLYFYPGIFHEDCEFTPRAYFYAKTMFVYGKPIYNYRQTEGGIMKSNNAKKKFDLIFVVKRLESFLNRTNEGGNYNRAFHSWIALLLNSSLMDSLAPSTSDDKRLYDEQWAKNKALINHFLKSQKLKYLLEFVLFKLSPLKMTQSYKLIHHIIRHL